MVLKTYWYNCVYGRIIHNSQTVEATQVSLGRWMENQNAVHTFSERLFGLKEDGCCDRGYDLDEV